MSMQAEEVMMARRACTDLRDRGVAIASDEYQTALAHLRDLEKRYARWIGHHKGATYIPASGYWDR